MGEPMTLQELEEELIRIRMDRNPVSVVVSQSELKAILLPFILKGIRPPFRISPSSYGNGVVLTLD